MKNCPFLDISCHFVFDRLFLTVKFPFFFSLPAWLSGTSVPKVIYYPRLADNRCFESRRSFGCLRTALEGNATAVYVLASAAAR